MKVGQKVVCRGVFSPEWSLVGVVEEVFADGMCWVRLTNGNAKLFPKDRVKPATTVRS